MAGQRKEQGLSTWELQSLLLAGQAMSQEMDPERICRWVADAVCSLSGASLAAVALAPGRYDTPRAVYGTMRESPISKLLAGELADLADLEWPTSQRPGMVATLQKADLPSGLIEEGINNLVRVPVQVVQREIGDLMVGTEEPWAAKNQEQFILTTLANQAAIALENVRLRREANEQAQTLRGLIQASPLAIIAHDRDARVQMWNPAAEQIFGWTEAEVLGHLYPVVPEEMEDEFRENIGRTLRGEALSGLETRRRKKDGTLIDVGIWTAPYGDGDAMVVIADITERKQAEVALREIAVIEERHRLARELHDSVTQSLYSTTLMAEAGRRLAASGDFERTQQYFGRLGETSQQALKEMRLLVYELRPLELEREGLIGAIRQRLDAVERRAGVETRLLFDETTELPAHLEEELYRIAQEALNNALKHAVATKVTISIAASGKRVELAVDDNGRGFDPDAVRNSGGMGLVSIGERIRLLGGSLDINSRPGEGTSVKVSVDF